ncbi:sensor domain-containing diguanylate cyclase [Kurthia sibirica]|uniref:GGDEF domain-containing protein n=1 Tax=Kurthia sibirica TaxID=202750 RepID=A0A2U3AQ76_9BACL|nr:sensor domain-containing diguanylate cyclase [Kurthia sibirica]PWI26674.1 GGDEF domain-containing protein [Kurthia sibirica]GEK32940.1 cell signaling regulator [Kurthia sibirica]
MKTKIKLQYLIIGVALLAFVLTSITSIWSGYKMNKTSLGDSAMETNRVYAQKLASTANGYLEETLKLLSANTLTISENIQDQNYLLKKADLIRNQTSAFNSVAIVDAQAIVLATSPQTLDLKGVKLTSAAMKQAIKKKTPLISEPYESISGRLIIFISVPIYSKNNDYLGLIGGTIYLKEDNVLSALLGTHPYEDGSTVYVVDHDGTVIYDVNSQRIGEDFSTIDVIQQGIKNDHTSIAKGENLSGQQAYIGFSHVKLANWTIFAQRPTNVAEAPAGDMVKKMIYVALPLLVFSLLVIILASYKIAKPLQRLAELTESSKSQNEAQNFKSVPAWYYEVIQLKESLILSFAYLHNQVHHLTDQSKTDPLTGLFNRRTLTEVMERWQIEDTTYSIILLDVDHFKKVNDTYGHDVGDNVLKYLAQTLKNCTRTTDFCCRYGGEEFIILLPNTTSDEAAVLAEKIRHTLEKTKSPSGEIITISAGVAEYPSMTNNPIELLKKADDALYYAKKHGRNQITIST